MHKFWVTMLVIGLAACSRASESSELSESNKQPSASTTKATITLPAGMSRVSDPAQVCMVNDTFMGRPQIPVTVEGRTYYGCCPMCKDKLEKQQEMRTARDPVSGEPVDKATAVIVQDGAGKILYFKDEATLRQFRG